MKDINFQAVDFYTGQVCKVNNIRLYNKTCHIILIDDEEKEYTIWRHYDGPYKNCELTYVIIKKENR